MGVPTPEQTRAANRYHAYRVGWMQGASNQATDSLFVNHPTLGAEYERGRMDGHTAQKKALAKAMKSYRHTPDLLRTAARDTPSEGAGKL